MQTLILGAVALNLRILGTGRTVCCVEPMSRTTTNSVTFPRRIKAWLLPAGPGTEQKPFGWLLRNKADCGLDLCCLAVRGLAEAQVYQRFSDTQNTSEESGPRPPRYVKSQQVPSQLTNANEIRGRSSDNPRCISGSDSAVSCVVSRARRQVEGCTGRNSVKKDSAPECGTRS